MMSARRLPLPDAAAQAHSAALTAHIIQRMTLAGGRLPFSEFMQDALYAPGLGYYSAGWRKFGADGDFITAPELSPLFSQCLAQQCAQILTTLPDDSRIILEFGAGTGRMAVDILRELAQINTLPAAYWILELSGELQQRQRALFAAELPELLPRIHWLSQLPENGFSGVILGNEVLDAMPIERFHITETQLERFYVAWDGTQFIWETAPYDDPMLSAILSPLLSDLPVGYVSEYNTLLAGWFRHLSCCFDKGLVLLIDYGFPRAEFYHPQRAQGTLMCHYRHHAHSDPLIAVGLQDITAHVDFTSVAESAVDVGFSVAGYCNQANFLLSCGLMDLVQNVSVEDTLNWTRQTQAVKRLLLPSEMGELFKVIALTRDWDAPLLGFRHDQQGRL
jgi:SAM-dependent MidA family methyltransferase